MVTNKDKQNVMCLKKSIKECFKCEKFTNCEFIGDEQDIVKSSFYKANGLDEKDLNTDKLTREYYKLWKEAYEFLEQYDFDHSLVQDAIMLMFDKLKWQKMNLVTDVYTSLLEAGLLDSKEDK